MEVDPFFRDTLQIDDGVSRKISRPEFELIDGWACINLPPRTRPLGWTFVGEVIPDAEPTNGGTLRRFCPLCTVQPVKMAGREQPLRRRHYADLCDTFWDCLTCHTTWREPKDGP